MKLYANTINLKGKAKGVGDDEMLHIELKDGNKYAYHVYWTLNGLVVFDIAGKLLWKTK